MHIKVKPMGPYQTNCYILTTNGKDYIIDPGMDATSWVQNNVTNPIAILNTHGHFDHVWSNSQLAKNLNIPIYCPKDDTFMLQNDPFGYGVPPSHADYAVKPDETVEIEGEQFTFRYFPGHTPGCSVIEYKDIWFSGDFLFRGSIGRWDFKYSNKKDMIQSLKKLKALKIKDKRLLPGHEAESTLYRELSHIDYWIKAVQNS
ncbi:MAG TPA: MBL fold metallo-hydrolase [Nitratifractor sp.]|nr:MBL fold metallo-hydrolase [Nitratifractor sp.]